METVKALSTLAAITALGFAAWLQLSRDPGQYPNLKVSSPNNSAPALRGSHHTDTKILIASTTFIEDPEFTAEMRRTGLNEKALELALLPSPHLKEMSHDSDWANKWRVVATERGHTLSAIREFANAGLWHVVIARVNLEIPAPYDTPEGWITTFPVLELLKEAIAKKESTKLEAMIVNQIVQDTRVVQASASLESVSEERRRRIALMKLLERALATPDEYNRMDRSKWVPALAARNGGGDLAQILLSVAPMVRP